MRRALIVYGGWDGHDPVRVSKIFRDILEEEGFSVELSGTLESFCDAEGLKGYDLIVPHWTMGEIPDKYARNVADAVASGVGIAGCHGGMCDAFRNCTVWQFMTGCQFVEHPGGDGTPYTVYMNRETGSPIIEGIEDFQVRSEQYYVHVDPAVKVLAHLHFPVVDGPHAANGEVDVPAIYTKFWGKGRVFYCSLGHTSEMFDETLRTIMRRGFLYAAREE